MGKWTTSHRRPSRIAVHVGVVAAVWSIAALGQPRLAGLTLEAAIRQLEDAGLRVFYSSNVVRPTMRVVEQPAGEDPRDWLRALVAPHGLTVVAGPRDSVLIVKMAAPTPPARAVPPPTAERAPIRAPLPPIEEIVVAASRYALARPIAGEPFRLANPDLEALPDLGDDSLRAVQRLPGAAANGFDARTHIRGGEVGELLVRLDQLRLYDPYHLEDFQGIFSNIDPRIVSTMDVYTGGFPAAFGDRMSGIIDVASLTPPAPRYHEIGVSFFNASLLSAGSFDDGDGEWLASLRRSNLDLLYSSFSKLPERPRYVDGFGKVAYRLTDTLRITLNALYSRDEVTLNDDLDVEESASSSHEDRYVWLRFEHTPSTTLTGTTLLAHTTLVGQRTGATAKPGVSTGWLFDQRDFALDTLQSEWTWRPLEAGRWSLQFGGALGRARGGYTYRDGVEFDVLVGGPPSPTLARERDLRVTPKGEQHAIYGSVRFEPTAKLSIDVGARWDHQTLDPGRSGSFDPRVSLRYRLGERTSLLASGGRFEQAQAINELQVSDGEERFFPPQRSRHAVLGLEHELASGVQLRFETYQKDMSRVRPRFENLLQRQSLLPELKPDRVRIAPDSARARGFEALVSDGRAARLDWWVSYSYGRVRDRVGDADVPRSWDQTRALSGGLGWETQRWNVGLVATHRSGWPRTSVLGLADGDDPPRIAIGPRNAERVGAFRSLDLRVMRAFSLHRGELSAFFEMTNALDRDNECCVEYEVELDELDEPVLGLSQLYYLPRVPSLGFVWSF
ncbi:MAG TPA: TonB-dependent receptor [Gammaproteobacteria bacterium]|nr:TonB-dependent receptor [Gammaproteobacteria bacterium]